MKQKLVFVLLLGILLFASAVRLYNLSGVAPSPYLDEVSNGYNAYSLMLTGKDEYGKSFPLLMQAYNDFRPTLFVYLMIPFIKIFDLSVFAIRLPAVLLSVLATFSLFFLTRELLARVDKKKNIQATPIALLASFLYAISPWSIYSSRIADEINMSLAFFIFGLTFFLYATNRQLKTLPFLLSVLCFVIAFYAYHGIKFFVPIFLLGLVIIFFKDLLTQWKTALLGLVLGVLLLIPLVIAFTTPGSTARLGGVNTQDPTIIARSAQRILWDKTNNNLVGQVFDNRRVALGLEFLNNYLRNFAPAWLFLHQGNSTFQVPDFGPFYLFELPLLLMGIVFLIKDDTLSKRSKIVLALWILGSALPAALSSQSPHLNRSNPLLPALTIIQAMGLYVVLRLIASLRNKLVKVTFYAVTGVIILVSFIWFLHAYFVLLPHERSKVYQYGLTDALKYVKDQEPHYDKIILSNGNNLLNGYMYYLFTNKYDPALHQKNGGTGSAFFTDTHLIGKYDFRDPNLYEPNIEDESKKQIKILYVTNPGELSPTIMKNENVRLLKKFYLLNGMDSIWILEGTVTR